MADQVAAQAPKLCEEREREGDREVELLRQDGRRLLWSGLDERRRAGADAADGLKGIFGDPDKYSLLGAQVPLFQNVVLVPNCAGKPGYGLAATWGSSPPDQREWKHEVNVAEVAIDVKKPRSAILYYTNRGGTRKSGAGDSYTVNWSGTVEVRVNGKR